MSQQSAPLASESNNNRLSYCSSRRGAPVILQDIVSQTWCMLKGNNADAADENGDEQDAIRSTQEALRLLETKVPVGRLGLKDRQEVRVAILLDLVLRKRQQNQQQNQAAPFNLKEVAQKMGLKFQQFEQLHSVIGNYFHEFQRSKQRKIQQIPIPATTAASLTNPRKRGPLIVDSSLASQRPKRNLTVDESWLESEKSILPDLVIRLALYLRDPASILQKTTAALKDLVRHTRSSKMLAADTRGQMYDFSRFWPAYQAAMLYHIVTVSAGTNTFVGQKKSASADNDDESTMNLKLEDLVQASTAYTFMELREKVDYIQQWAKEKKDKSPTDTKETIPKQKRSKNSKSSVANGSENKKDKNTTLYDSNSNNGDENINIQTESTDEDHIESTETKEFIKWKESILESACAKFANDTNCDPLQAAADQVLQKYGLLPDQRSDDE